jgi:tetratricopeptide (TPR) repeat protein
MSRDCESLCTPYRAVLLCILLLVALNACGFRQAPQETVVVDAAFERYTRTASVAFAQAEYAQAANLYRHALERAYARDDRGAIVDTQYNLAVVLLRSGLLEEARAAVDAAKVELTWGGQAVPAYLLLLEATLLYRKRETPAAWSLSEKILASAPAAEPEVIAKAHFLRGLMATERADTVRLREAMAALEHASSPELRADHAELRGHLALTERDWEVAVQAFATAAELRRMFVDSSSMARALAKAGEAAERNGRPQVAAVYYLRAGRSAFQLGQRQEAVDWLNRAQLLARETGDAHTLQEVRSHLARLQAHETDQGRQR